MITVDKLTDEMVRALNPEMTAIHIANQSPMSPAQHRVLAIAVRNGGFVAAGKGAHGGHVERVAASPIRALIERGFLKHCFGPDGGFAARLSERTKERICDAINAAARSEK